MASLRWRQKDVVLCGVICSSLNWLYYHKERSAICESLQSSAFRLNQSNKNKTYDFVIIGYGRAGKSAVETLRKKCPNASIAIFDPIPYGTTNDDKCDYYNSMVHQVNPERKEIVGSSLNNSVKINYKHSMLISTGCRRAPIPSNLIDRDASERVVELFSTKPSNKRSLSSEAVYAISKMASEQGASITVLGSGLEALFIALSSASKKHDSKVKLMFGDSSPLSRMLPAYLTVQISQRLRKIGVDVQERTLVRYVMPSFTSNGIEMHTVKAYDSLLTERSCSDLILGKLG